MSFFSSDSCVSCGKSIWLFQRKVSCDYCGKFVCSSCNLRHRTQHRIGNDFPYSKTGDPGVVQYLTQHGKPVVTASSTKRGYPKFFIQQDITGLCLWTKNEPNAWFLVDLGEGYSCHPTHYTLGYGSPKAYCTPRNWLLQATNDIKSNSVTDWDTIKRHENDTSLRAGDNVRQTWKIECPEGSKYRFFRVVQVGPNSYKSKSMIQAEEDWKVERLLWIAFKKENAQSCGLAKLPKDIILTIILFLDKKRPQNSWSNSFCVAGFELFGRLFLPLSPSHADQSDDQMS